MVDNAIQATISDEIFESTYYKQFLDIIQSWKEYIVLEKILSKHNYTIRFYYCKDQSFGVVTYFIEFEVLDSKGNVVKVPESSEYFDRLFTLTGSGQVLYFKKRSRKIFIEFDEEELKRDMSDILKYLLEQ